MPSQAVSTGDGGDDDSVGIGGAGDGGRGAADDTKLIGTAIFDGKIFC